MFSTSKQRSLLIYNCYTCPFYIPIVNIGKMFHGLFIRIMYGYKADTFRYKADAFRYKADTFRYKADTFRYKVDTYRYKADAFRYNL